MKEILEKSKLGVVETFGFKIDFEEYDIIDFSYVEKNDVFYKNKWSSITAENYLIQSLEKGYGVFL